MGKKKKASNSVEPKKEKNLSNKNEEKNIIKENNSRIKIDDKTNRNIIIMAIVLLLIIALVFSRYLFSGNISSVGRILDTKYDSISCINSDCDGLKAEIKRKNNTVVKILDSKGSAIGKYTYKNDDKEHLEPYSLTKKYMLMKKTLSKESEKYYITNKRGAILYETRNKLIKINNDYVIEQIPAKIDYEYKIFNSKGKLVHKNITNYESYDNNKFIYIEKDDNNFILNTNNGKVFNKYKVKEEIKDADDKTLYLILTKKDNDLYYFFNVNFDEVNYNGFRTYTIKNDKSLIVSRKENNNNTKYSISSTGTEKKLNTSKFMSDVIKKYNSKIDSSKFYLYSASIVDENQDNVIVDNLSEKSLGIYNVDSKKYKSIYSYNADKFYSSINEVSSTDGNTYVQISCTEATCEKDQMVVYNISKDKVIFKLEGKDKVASEYIQYKNGYKVVKYSYQSNDENIRGKYALYDSNNKEINTSAKEIRVIDSEFVTGKVSDSSLLIYSSNKKKMLNDEDNLAELVRINKNNYYKYSTKKKNYIVDENGKEVYSYTDGSLEYSNDNIYAVGTKNVRIYNISSDKVSTYKFLNNENTLNDSNKKISPFNGALFVNNSNKKYIKVIDGEGNVIKKLDKVTMFDLKTNEETKRAFIIVKADKNKTVKYGLYLAK